MTRWFGKLNWDFLKHIFMVSKYILERSRELCSKPFSQQSMKSMVALSETNASVAEFDGNK